MIIGDWSFWSVTYFTQEEGQIVIPGRPAKPTMKQKRTIMKCPVHVSPEDCADVTGLAPVSFLRAALPFEVVFYYNQNPDQGDQDRMALAMHGIVQRPVEPADEPSEEPVADLAEVEG